MEANHNPTCPIAGEPALIDAPALVSVRAMLNLALNGYEEAMRGMPRYGPALDLTSTVDTAIQWIDDLLGLTTADYPEAEPANQEDEEEMGEWIDAETGEPLGPMWVTAEEAIAEMRAHADAEDAEGEMRAEAEAERLADARLELAAELASCDWEGWD